MNQAPTNAQPAAAATAGGCPFTGQQAARHGARAQTGMQSNANWWPEQLNLAILHDLFLGDTARAQVLYQRYAELVPGEAAQVNRWLAELKARKPAVADKPAATPTNANTAANTAAAPKETPR
jgi:hypothetical protein